MLLDSIFFKAYYLEKLFISILNFLRQGLNILLYNETYFPQLQSCFFLLDCMFERVKKVSQEEIAPYKPFS